MVLTETPSKGVKASERERKGRGGCNVLLLDPQTLFKFLILHVCLRFWI